MCSADGELLAIIDWGDAGWGDPSLDFAAIPFSAIQSAFDGYEAEAPGSLGALPEARVAWSKLLDAVVDLWENPAAPTDVEACRRLARSRTS